jgi:hypothetical protein
VRQLAAALLLAVPAMAEEPQIIFAGREQTVRVTVPFPPAEQTVRLGQIATGMVLPVGSTQTVAATRAMVLSVPVTVPVVRAPMYFVVVCAGHNARILAVPADVLAGLGKLVDEERPLGVYDPDGKLRAALKAAGVAFVDFESEPRDCRLIIVWTRGAFLPASVKSRADRGTPLVWVREDAVAKVATRGRGVTVYLAALPVESAAMQFNLVRSAELALAPAVPAATATGENEP